MTYLEPETMYDPDTEYAEYADTRERTWALAAHLSALSIFAGVPFGNVLGPLVVWLIKKDEMPLVDDQGKEALNFQISMTLYLFAAIVAVVVLVGLVLIPLVLIFGLVMPIVAAIRSYDGEYYRYPLTIRFIE